MIMPCGTGKTMVGIGLAARLDLRLILVVVPTLALIRQTASRWKAAYGPRLNVLFACSDGTLRTAEDEVPTTAGALAQELSTTVTTDTDELAGVLRRWSRSAGAPAVAFATYASLDRAVAAARRTGTRFDLVIADEAHHCAGPWDSAWTALARYGPDDVGIANRRLFLTATPRLRPRNQLSTDAGVGMDDAAAFGPVAYRLALAEAVRLGLLADYQVAVVGVRTDELAGVRLPPAGTRTVPPQVVVRDERHVQGLLEGPILASTFALSRAMATYRLRRILTFHARVRDAKAYAAAAPALLRRSRPTVANLRITASAASAAMSDRDRHQVIARFAEASGDHAVIASNVRCLAEGVDIPSLEAVLFADPRHGLVDVVQAVGRVMRPHPGKTKGLVILPVMVPSGRGRRSGFAVDERFEDVLRILQILREHDSVLAAQLTDLRRDVGRSERARPIGPGDLAGDGPLRLLLPRGLPDDFVHAFSLRLLTATTSTWDERYGAAQRWSACHGHANVPTGAVVDGVRLGGWVHEQRSLYARRLLAPARAEALERLPGWVWTPWDAAWDRAFGLLSDYVLATGTSRVPQSHRAEGFALGAWVKAQRELQQKGRLPAGRAERLAALPEWYWRAPRRARSHAN